jgi:hypothetical protein
VESASVALDRGTSILSPDACHQDILVPSGCLQSLAEYSHKSDSTLQVSLHQAAEVAKGSFSMSNTLENNQCADSVPYESSYPMRTQRIN